MSIICGIYQVEEHSGICFLVVARCQYSQIFHARCYTCNHLVSKSVDDVSIVTLFTIPSPQLRWACCLMEVTRYTSHIHTTDSILPLALSVRVRGVSPSTMLVLSLTFHGHYPGCLDNPIFSNLVSCAACWAHFMCHHELWPTSVGHPFSSLNISLGLTGGKYYQKIIIAILELFLKKKNCFSVLLFEYHFLSLSFLLTFLWLACYCSMRLCFSQGIYKVPRVIVNWHRVAVSNHKST